MGGSAAARGLAVVQLAIVGLVAEASDFGAFGVTVSAITAVSATFELTLHTEIARLDARRGESQRRETFRRLLLPSAALLLAIAVAALYLIEGPRRWLAFPMAMSRVAALSAIGSLAVAMRERRFAGLAVVEVGQALVRLLGVVGVLLLFTDDVFVALAVGYSAMSLVQIGAGWYFSRKRVVDYSISAGPVGFRVLGNAAYPILRHGHILVAGLVLSATEVGYYYFVFQLLWQFVVLLTRSIRRVAIGVATPESAAEATQTEALIKSAFAACLSLALLGPAAVIASRVVWGDRWVEAEPSMLVLAAAFPFYGAGFLSEVAVEVGSGARTWSRVVIARVLMTLLALGAGLLVLLRDGGADSLAFARSFSLALVFGGAMVLYLGRRQTEITHRLRWQFLAYASVIMAATNLLERDLLERTTVVVWSLGSLYAALAGVMSLRDEPVVESE